MPEMMQFVFGYLLHKLQFMLLVTSPAGIRDVNWQQPVELQFNY